MASSTAFMMVDTEFPDDLGESIVDESDFEGFDDGRQARNGSSRFYWLGKRIFTQCITDDVFDESTPASTGDDLDVSDQHH